MILILAYGLVAVRIAGRRVFGKWSALDVIVSITIGSSLSRALTGNAPLFATMAATTLLLALHWLLAWAAARWPAISRLVEGKAIDLGIQGDVAHGARIRHTVSEADLAEALRRKGIERAAEARKITLEPSGTINVLK